MGWATVVAVAVSACTSASPPPATSSAEAAPTSTVASVTTTAARVPPATTSTTAARSRLEPSQELTAVATVRPDGVWLGACGIGPPNSEITILVAGGGGVSLPVASAASDDRGVFCGEGPLLDPGVTAAGDEVPVEPGRHSVVATVDGSEIAAGAVTIVEGPDAEGIGSVDLAVERPRGIDAIAIHAIDGFATRLVGDPDDVVVRQVPAEGWAALGSELWVETGPTLHDARPVGYEVWSGPEPELGRYYEAWDADVEWDFQGLAAAALAGGRPQMSRTMTLLVDALPLDAVPIAQSWTIDDWEPVAESGHFVLAETGEYLGVSIESVEPPFALNEDFLGGFEAAEDGWTRRVDVGGDPPSLFRVFELSPDGRMLVDVWLESEPPTYDAGEPRPHDTYDEGAAIELAAAIRRRIHRIRTAEVTEPDGPLNEREWLVRDAFGRMGVDECCGEPAHGGTAATRGFEWRDGTEILVLAAAPDRIARRRLGRPTEDRSVIGHTLVERASDGTATFFCGFSGFEIGAFDERVPPDALDELVVRLCG